jgi:hypothetical protein
MLKNINIEEFKSDLLQSPLILDPASDVESLVEQYNSVLLELINKIAPEKSKVITIWPTVLWMTPKIKAAKHERKLAERKWRNSSLEIHRSMYQSKRNHVTHLIDQSKKQHFSRIIHDSTGNQKAFFKTVNQLLCRGKCKAIPTDTLNHNLSDMLADFFTDKIQKIRSDLEFLPHRYDHSAELPHPNLTTHLTCLQPVSQEVINIKKTIMSRPSKSCALDPLPTSILKNCIDELLPTITNIVNTSIQSATVPSCFKNARITPVLKKDNLDSNALKNYRPISNLPLLTKLTERIVSEQLVSHMHSQDMQEKVHAAYRKHHSTETVLLCVVNDILLDIDNQKCVFLVLLDLSVASTLLITRFYSID